MNDLTAMRSSRQQLEAELRLAGAIIKGKSVKCCFHDDRNPSGDLYEKDGVWRFKCHGCKWYGDIFDVRAKRLGRELPDILKEADGAGVPERNDEPAPKAKRVFPTVDDIVASVGRMGDVEAHYDYADPATGRIEIVQVRYIDRDSGKKKFLTHHAADGGFVLGAPPKPWPLYNRKRLLAADPIVIVEGEKCVHALHKLGIVATTSLSGAGNADKADWSPCAGKWVYLWRDYDDSGKKFISEVVARLEKLEPPPRMKMLTVESLGLPEGGDAADFIDSETTASEVWQVLEDGSEDIGPSAELFKRIDDIISGKWQSIDWPWRALSSSCKSLFPGTITVLCGDPSSNKSFFLLEAMYHWHRRGISVDLLELEEDRAFFLHRLFAVLSGSWDVLNDEWGRNNAATLAGLLQQHEPRIQDFSPHLHSAPLGQFRYKEVLEWIEARCQKGAKIIGIDPVTAVSTGESRQNEDLSFIVTAAKILREYDARLILVTHPRQSLNPKGGTQDDLAGGRAFSRHTQTVLMLHRHEKGGAMSCMTSDGAVSVACNRVVRIAKARNAPGHGHKIGFHLGNDARFHERGVIIEKGKPEPTSPAPKPEDETENLFGAGKP